VANSKKIAQEVIGCEVVEYDETNPVNIGWSYNFETKEFINPYIIEITE